MRRYHRIHNNKGMTLVEIMIAMVLGLLITLAITSLFLTQRESYQQNEATARMQENARFAQELMVQDLRHAGFFGDVPEPSDIVISTDISDTNTNNCLGSILDFNSPDVLISYGNKLSDPDATTYADCVASADISANDSSVLIVKRSASSPTADASLADNTLYTHANGGAAELFTTAFPASITGGENWAYQPHVYYIDTENQLQRKYLTNHTGVLATEPLAEGIEAFHIEFGIDEDNNGAPEYFYTPATDNISDSTLDNAVSATVYILARTADTDRNYQDTKTYQLGGMAYGPYNDGYHRRVYTMTTALKNIRSQVMLQQGP